MKKPTFRQIMIGTAVFSGVLTLALVLGYQLSPDKWLLSAAITCGTICYHFTMRLLVGAAVPASFDHRTKWFQPRKWEAALYRHLRLSRWKRRMPTYDPRKFSVTENTPKQLIANMCQAEVVHEVISLFSFVPVAFSAVWDSFGVFFVTSTLAAALDLTFVMLQRYNRPRLVRILEKQKGVSIHD